MTFFKIKYSFKFVILSIFLALLLTIIPIMGLKNKDVYILIMHCYGTLNVNLIDKIYPITFWILPQIIVLSILGNCIYKDFNKNAAFIFSRADSRTKLLLYKIKYIFIWINEFFIISFLTIIILSLMLGYSFSNYYNIFILYINLVMYYFFIVILTNVLSLFMKPIYAIYTELIFKYMFLMISFNIAKSGTSLVAIIKYFPTSQGILNIHSNIIDSTIDGWFRISGFTINFSLIYLLIGIIITIIIGIYKFKNTEFI
ncbi:MULTISPECIES: hypothetical protein [Clostridium]|uniref:hypothetical protein n=3 Tax=Clostridiaceae TaxID=31979 RepID=UPI0004DA883A|nr:MULTISPECIES: hypothetical protein [Clostridium]KEI07995.1 hypothetical protein Z958_p0186 [Clostridium novyi B str. NCTC 9691]OOB76423.1 hypothetical protein AXF41_12310 [Clostridium haemolyticum]